MKNIFLILLVFFGITVFCAAEGITEEAGKDSKKKDTSYAFGMVVAKDVTGTGLEFDYNAFARGFRDVIEKAKTRYTLDEAMEMIQTAYKTAQAEIGERNREAGAAFLAENGKRPGVVTLDSGLQYEVISEGSGETPGRNDVVRVNYKGTTIDGTVFDSSYDRGEPAEMPLKNVIPGWFEGLTLMKEGGKSKLYIPPKLAYGSRGAGAAIGPNSTLIFEVELLAIVRHGEEAEKPEAANPPNPNASGELDNPQ